MTNRNLSLDRGGQARTVKGVEARRKIQRLAQEAAVALDVKEVREHRHWLYDLRRGKHSLYGGLLRYLDIAIRQGKKRDELQRIPRWLSEYINEVA